MELGIYSFGDTAVDPSTGRPVSTGQALRNLVEAAVVADQVGLDYVGVGEHHLHQMPASSPATVLAAAASLTSSIQLGSAVTVLSTDDPVRVYQQFATLDAVSGGRAEITAGRGSLPDSFQLFGYDLNDYDQLFAEKLELLMRINGHERVTWSGTTRPSLQQALVVPRPLRGTLPVWLGSGGSTGSAVRAGQLGLPIAYGIIGGDAHRFEAQVQAYRGAVEFRKAAGAVTDARVAVASPGFLHKDARTAKDTAYLHWASAMTEARGLPAVKQSKALSDPQYHGRGAVFAGSPEEIADRIVDLHHTLRHDRHILQIDVGHLPQADFLRSIELLGTEVAPLVRPALS